MEGGCCLLPAHPPHFISVLEFAVFPLPATTFNRGQQRGKINEGRKDMNEF